MKPAGTLRGDRSQYTGRHLVGFTRASTAGVLAFDAEGRVIGTFTSEKAAASALRATHVSGGQS